MKQENKQGISSITMKPSAICFCPLGNDYYTNHFEAYMELGDSFPDYIDVKNFINDQISQRPLIIEDAVKILFDYLMEYQPIYLSVESNVDDAESHFPVKVAKESGWKK